MAVYGLCVLLLFSASSLYHAKKREENEVSLFRKLDHAAIFFMIAGTYTAVSFLSLDGLARWTVIILQWSLVGAGVIFRLFWLRAPRALYTAIYLGMGWVAIFLIRELHRSMPGRAFVFLFAGGLAYTIGAVFYLMKRPRGRFGFHEIWHLFILAGAGLHYLMVYISLTGTGAA